MTRRRAATATAVGVLVCASPCAAVPAATQTIAEFPQGHPSPTVVFSSASGVSVATWVDREGSLIATYSPVGSRWTRPAVIGQLDDASPHVAACVTRRGEVVVAWVHEAPDGDAVVARTLSGGRWTRATVVHRLSSGDEPTLGVVSADEGTVLAVGEARSTWTGIRDSATGQWEAAGVLPGRFGDLTVGAQGAAIVARTTARGGKMALSLSQRRRGSWHTSAVVRRAASLDIVRFGVDSRGRLTLTWWEDQTPLASTQHAGGRWPVSLVVPRVPSPPGALFSVAFAASASDASPGRPERFSASGIATNVIEFVHTASSGRRRVRYLNLPRTRTTYPVGVVSTQGRRPPHAVLLDSDGTRTRLRSLPITHRTGIPEGADPELAVVSPARPALSGLPVPLAVSRRRYTGRVGRVSAEALYDGSWHEVGHLQSPGASESTVDVRVPVTGAVPVRLRYGSLAGPTVAVLFTPPRFPRAEIGRDWNRIAAGDNGVWLLGPNSVGRLDEEQRVVLPAVPSARVFGFVFADGQVWGTGDTTRRLIPGTPPSVGPRPSSPAAAGDGCDDVSFVADDTRRYTRSGSDGGVAGPDGVQWTLVRDIPDSRLVRSGPCRTGTLTPAGRLDDSPDLWLQAVPGGVWAQDGDRLLWAASSGGLLTPVATDVRAIARAAGTWDVWALIDGPSGVRLARLVPGQGPSASVAVDVDLVATATERLHQFAISRGVAWIHEAATGSLVRVPLPTG